MLYELIIGETIEFALFQLPWLSTTELMVKVLDLSILDQCIVQELRATYSTVHMQTNLHAATITMLQ